MNFRFLLMLEHGGKADDGVGERAESPGLRQAVLALVVQRDPFGWPAVEAIDACVAYRAGEVAAPSAPIRTINGGLTAISWGYNLLSLLSR